jgi:flavin-dependent thymidylate synthase
MNISLLSVTPDALNLLLRTKNTRLGASTDPSSWSAEERTRHLAYMRDTIKSSWEFVDYVFQIEGVTRAFTHQLVRTRAGSYAQESQRTVDVREQPALMPDAVAESTPSIWSDVERRTRRAYEQMVDVGVPLQDARGILPTATATSIIAKFSLRTLHEMAKVRLCTRTQGEYQRVFREMRARVIEVHPWVLDFGFIEVACVADGTCAFPRYGREHCRFWREWMDNADYRAQQFVDFWREDAGEGSATRVKP